MVLLYYEHISNVHLLEHTATKKSTKNPPKTLPKRRPNPLKIDANIVLFFNIDFFGFRPRFGQAWSSQHPAKLAMLASKISPKIVPRAFLSCRRVQIASWKPPGMMLESPSLDFEPFLATCLWYKNPFSKFVSLCAFLCHRNACLQLLFWTPRPTCIHQCVVFLPFGAAVCAQHIRRLPKGCQACQI